MIAQEPQVVLKTILRTRAKNNFAGKDAPWGERAGSLGENSGTPTPKKPETHAHARTHARTNTHLGKSCHVFLPAEGRRLFILPSVYCGRCKSKKKLSHLTHKNNAYIEQQGVLALFARRKEAVASFHWSTD